jgi:23S rRNA G2445 N2-methylase RlmL
VADTARARLLGEYEPLTKERLDLGRYAGVLPRAEVPVYRWIRYKEAYSPHLVRDVLDELLPAGSGGRERGKALVYDPMVGSGTSLLVAAERGLPALGADLMPYAVFLSSTISRWHEADPALVRQVAEDALARCGSIQGGSRAAVPAAGWAFSPAVAGCLIQLLDALDLAPAGVDRDLVRLAVLSAVEQVSYAVKDGTSLRRRLPGGSARPGRPGQQREEMDAKDVIAGVRERVGVIATDLEQIWSASSQVPGCLAGLDGDAGLPAPALALAAARGGTATTVVHADARQWRPTRESCAAVVFSPPYPNRYDYSAIYQLELALGGFVSDAAGLRRVRKQLLRSHLEAPPREEYRVELPALREFLAAVNASRMKGDQSGRVLRMVAGFFEDMAEVMRQVAEALRPGASAAVVVATQTYLGQHLPTDLLLAELGRDVGLEVRALWVVRTKGVASQQRGRVVAASRETILMLRKPASAHCDRDLMGPAVLPCAGSPP